MRDQRLNVLWHGGVTVNFLTQRSSKERAPASLCELLTPSLNRLCIMVYHLLLPHRMGAVRFTVDVVIMY